MINYKILKLYKKIIPKKLAEKISIWRNAGGLNTIRREIISYYEARPAEMNFEIQEALLYLRKHPISIFPYLFPRNYHSSEILVHFDSRRGLNYVMHDGKKLYFKRSMNTKQVKEYYNSLRIEQDSESPHKYITETFNVKLGEIVADIGSAEGIFGLSIIENAGKLFLFENDKEWVEALEATFSPWGSKVYIINKSISNTNNSDHITLDYFAKEQSVIFDLIKIDVDGGEYKVLEGCHQILSSSQKPKISICTYHKGGDESMFRDFFSKYDIKVENSRGYMIFIYENPKSAPYLRRGLLRSI